MIKNTLYIFAGRVSNAVFLFLLTLVISRQLGPELFGVFSFLTTVVVSASCFSNLGLDTWMVREVTKNPPRAQSYLSNILGLKIGTSLVTIFFVLLIFYATDLSDTTLHLLSLFSISILFNTLSQTLWHYGNCFKEFIYHSVLWASSNVMKAVLGIVLVLLYHDLEFLVWGVVVAEALSLVLSFFVIRRRFGAFVPTFHFQVWREFLVRSAPIALGMIFSVLYFRLDIVMLQLMTGERIVGFYSAAYKLFEVVVILPHSCMLVLFPTMVEEYHANRSKFKASYARSLWVYGIGGGGIALLLWSFSHEIILMIYGDKFNPSGEVLGVLAIAVFLFFINFLLSNVLITSGREKVNTWNLLAATVLNIALNMIWIPQYGMMGAAWATVLCEVVLVIALSLEVRKTAF